MPSASAIYWIADRMAPRVRAQFLKHVYGLQARITIRSIETAVGSRGWPTTIARAFESFEKDLRASAGSSIDLVWLKTAEQVERQILKRAGVVGRFDLVNPAAIDAATYRSSLLIRSITAETRAAVQQVIARSIATGVPPRIAALQIRPLVGLTPRQMATVANYRSQLLEAGASQTAAAKAGGKYAKKLLADRANTIARTETIRASVDGQQDVWKSAKTEGLISADAEQQWIVADDERLCPICGALADQTAPIDGSFTMGSGSISGPPAHPRCRCALGLVYNSTRRR